MASSIDLLKPGRCLPPRYKSYFLDVGAAVQPDKDSANNQTFHADSSVNELPVARSIKPVGGPVSAVPTGGLASRSEVYDVKFVEVVTTAWGQTTRGNPA